MSTEADPTSHRSGSRQKPGGLRQKFFNILGWIAFILLLPPIIAMFGRPELLDFLKSRFGQWSSGAALVGYFYVLLFLRVFFGSDQRYTPILIGYFLSFLCFSVSLDITFMSFFANIIHKIPIFEDKTIINAMFLVTGAIIIFLANALSTIKKTYWVLDIFLLCILPLGALTAAGIFLPSLLGF